MDDRETTLQLATVLGVTVSASELDPLFEIAPELIEWSINSAADARGVLRTSAWTRDHARAAAVIARVAPELTSVRERLLDDGDFEGLGLASRGAGAATLRWWTLAGDGAAMADRARTAWPEHAAAIDRLLAAAGGASTCAAAGLESGAHSRQTIYARLRDPAAAIRVLELAGVPTSQPASLFWKGICGLEPGGRDWPQVWVGHSHGRGGGWKFYYFARGDELRRTDAVLLDAVRATPVLARACEVVGGPCIQLIGLTIRPSEDPAFTVYLARR